MKRMISTLLLTCMVSSFVVGCSDTTTAKTEKTISGPGGSTTVTTEQKVKTTGENPPAP